MTQPLNILIVEDSPNDAELILEKLHGAGIDAYSERVETAGQFEAALARRSWDLVLSDFSLPGFSGLDALRSLRARGMDLPFLLISGTVGEETAVEAIHSGADDYLLKDRLQRLAPAVRRALERASDRRRRDQAEADLQDSREQFTAFMDHSPMIAWMKDEQGAYLHVNREWSRVFGRTPEEAIGRNDGDLFPADTAAQLAESDRKALETGAPIEFTDRAPVPGAVVREWQVWKFPFRSAAGRRFVGGMAQDITDRKRLKEQFLRAQKMEGIGRLAGGVAHDFNNLLTVITGYGQLALAQVPADHPIRSPLGEVMRAAERAAALTRQLLAFSRRQILQPTVLDLNAVVTGMQGLLTRLIGEDVAVRTALAKGLGRVRADAGQIEQVIMNLAVNARDAMPKGGVLTIETSDAALDEAYAREHVPMVPGPYVLLAVSDNGVGMSEETKAKIFEPFFTTKEAGKGTGLGLSTVYGIVKQSGGYVWVYSEPGKGTTFKIYLPRVAEDAEIKREHAEKARSPAASLQGSETILLVEDDDAIRRLASEVLRERGYTVVEASKGDEALARTQGHPGTIHLLLTDVVTPGMKPRDLAARLTEARPGLKVLFMSGYAENAIHHQGVLDPRFAFLPKPFTPEGLLRKVRDTLRPV